MDYHWHFTKFSVKHFYCFRDSKYLNIILICAHMAWNPQFSADSKMCLMGDIQSGSYYLASANVHLSKCIFRILIHTLSMKRWIVTITKFSPLTFIFHPSQTNFFYFHFSFLFFIYPKSILFLSILLSSLFRLDQTKIFP